MDHPMQSSVTSHDDDDDMQITEPNWLSMKKRIHLLINKLKIPNIQFTAREIMNLNLIPGRGLFCEAIMKSQIKYPENSNIYAALVAIINPEFPCVGLLLVKRVVWKFKQACDARNRISMEGSSKFLAHLVNQSVVYEILGQDILLHLLVNPNSDNVKVAAEFFMECGSSLTSLAPHKTREIFKEFKRLVLKGPFRKSQVPVLRIFVARGLKFRFHPRIIDGLDLVEPEDQVTHHVSLLHDIDPETSLNEFQTDLEFDELPCESFGSISLKTGEN